MRDLVGAKNDGNRGQKVCFRKQHKIGWDHDLFGIQPKLHRDFFHSVDGSAVDVGLTGFAQAPVADRDAEALG